jgi:Flp pilus assembly protein, secretin CpaC
MNKPTLSLAISVSLAVAQASWQAAESKGVSSEAAKEKAPVATAKAEPINKIATTTTTNAIDENHAMLFLGRGKSAAALGAEPAPAAALSIHPSLPAAMPTKPVASQTKAPSVESASEIPIDESINAKTLGKSPERSSDMVAQFAADNLIAQGQSSEITASPIPPVVTGTVDLEEFKSTNVIDLKVSRSRTFKLRNKVVRTSISDPGVAEPVIVAENQMVLLGKAPGKATLVLWDDAGNSTAIELRVTRDYSQLQATLREIDPRIIVKTYSVGGSDRVILLGDVDHVESVVRAFAAANVFMDDRGMTIQVANNRLITARIGEVGSQGGGTGGGASTGQLAQLNSVDRYTYFPNLNNNISLAQGIVSDGGRVTSMIKVRKVPLIALHITFMEMNTGAARNLGIALGLNFTGAGFAFSLGGGGTGGNSGNNLGYLISDPGSFALNSPTGGNGTFGGTPTSRRTYTNQQVTFVNPTSTLFSSNAANLGAAVFPTQIADITNQILYGIGAGGTAFQTAGLGNLFTAINNFQLNEKYRFSISPSVQGNIGMNRARVLAEPTLVTISGERASFLAGGEIPILQTVATAGQQQFSVTFEPFGLRINMIPVLMDNGSLNIEIAPEERLISNQFAFNFPGSSGLIPGFTTRKTQTMVEMKPGQELFLSGLVTSANGRQLNKTPIYGEIPVLGALNRSKSFNKNESELVIAIRPEIILPGTPGQLKLPEEIGRVEGPRDMNMFAVEPTVVDERHYTSGRSERHQKTSPTLPEGAPIPDMR